MTKCQVELIEISLVGCMFSNKTEARPKKGKVDCTKRKTPKQESLTEILQQVKTSK